MIYPWLKALHVFAVILWIGGMMAAQLALTYAARGGEGRGEVLQKARGWDIHVTVPAMAASWILGLWMVNDGGWFPSGWLTVKLAFVVVISAVHGVNSGRLRRPATGVVKAPQRCFGSSCRLRSPA